MTNSNTPSPDEFLQQAAEPLKQIQSAIASAPIDELRAPIEKEQRLSEIADREDLRDGIEDLAHRAMLGHEEAISELVYLGCWIADFLDGLVNPSNSSESRDGEVTVDKPQNASDRDYAHPGDWQGKLNSAANRLCSLVAQHGEPAEIELRRTLDRRPKSLFSFPLDCLLAWESPPTATLLVSNLCDHFFQERLDAIRAAQIRQTTAQSWYWPVAISAIDYHKKRKITSLAPDLGLGRSIGVDLTVRPKQSDGPAEIALRHFIRLDRERTAPRATTHLAEWQWDDEHDIPAPLKKLIAVAGKAEEKKLAAKWPGKTWNLQNIWKRKAALLPPLSTETIEAWVDAAFACAASDCNGRFEQYEWPDRITREVARHVAVTSAVKEFLSEGFRTITKRGV